MKITIVTASITAGGAQRVITQLLNEWVKKGVECSLVLLRNEDIFYEIDEKVKIYKIGKIHTNDNLNKLRQYVEVRKIVKKICPDVVLSLPEEIGIYVIGALFGMNIPVVVSERNNPKVMPYKKISRLLRHILYLFVDGLIFQTKGAASFFPKYIQKKGIILPNPLDLKRLPKIYEGQRKKKIVSVGRLEKQKNFPLLINAFDEFWLEHQDYDLVIYGEGSQRLELEKLISDKKSKGNIFLPGRDNNVLDKIKDASMFVLSSDYEGVPNALIEAMAIGLPCISTDCEPGGARELIKNGENGIIVKTNDIKQLKEQMNVLSANVEYARKLSCKAIKIRSELEIEHVSEAWLEFLTKIINKRRKC